MKKYETAALAVLSIFFLVFTTLPSYPEEYCRFDNAIDLEYSILSYGGQINAVCFDKDAQAFGIFLTPNGDGAFEIIIPRDVIDIRNTNCTDKKFHAVGDLRDIPDKRVHDTHSTNEFRTIEIHYKINQVKEYFVLSTSLGTMERYKLGEDCQGTVQKEDLPPRQQLAYGDLPEAVICREGLKLIFKSSNNSPACVKPKTVEKLLTRGWKVDGSSVVFLTEKSEYKIGEEIKISMKNVGYVKFQLGSIPVGFEIWTNDGQIVRNWQGPFEQIGVFPPDHEIIKTWYQTFSNGEPADCGDYTIKKSFGHNGRTYTYEKTISISC